MDFIQISDLKLNCRVGTDPGEQEKPQELWIDMQLASDLRLAACSDKLADAIDYREVVCSIEKCVSRESFNLIEALAERIAGMCLARYPLKQVTVRVSKPAPFDSAVNVAVQIVRSAK